MLHIFAALLTSEKRPRLKLLRVSSTMTIFVGVLSERPHVLQNFDQSLSLRRARVLYYMTNIA